MQIISQIIKAIAKSLHSKGIRNRPFYTCMILNRILLPRILCWIRQACWLIVSDILDAKILEHLKQGLTYVRECYSTMVWIALLDQYVAIEATHLVDSEDTDTTE